MKKPNTISLVIIACLILIGLGLFAQENHKVVTVAEAGSMDGGTWVILEGKIDSRLSGETFLFSDNTGQIELKIPEDHLGDYDAERLTEVYGKIIIEDDIEKIEVKKVMYTD